MFLILLRNGSPWLRMRQETNESVLDQIMEVNNATVILISIVHTRRFVERK